MLINFTLQNGSSFGPIFDGNESDKQLNKSWEKWDTLVKGFATKQCTGAKQYSSSENMFMQRENKSV